MTNPVQTSRNVYTKLKKEKNSNNVASLGKSNLLSIEIHWGSLERQQEET